MKEKEIKSSFLLLLAAAIWGFAFVAQRIGAKYVGAFTFNGVRFALGSISLIPLIFVFSKNEKKSEDKIENTKSLKLEIIAGVIAGCVLFCASSLQQIGLAYTTAGKAGFITGLYIVLVPVFGIFLKQHIRLNAWIAVIISLIGLYLLSVTGSFSISKGDLLEIIGAFFWASHILVIDHFTKKVNALKLSCFQFATCSLLSLLVALFIENISITSLNSTLIPLLYGGICSVGIAYTLQAIGQKYAKPSHAAVLLSMESVFASIGGLLILHENFGVRGYLGCVLMLTGMLLSQLQASEKNANN